MKRLVCLDGVRGLLAFYVLLGHMAPFAVLPDWMQDAVSHGGAAVDLFFVLSGLVITQSLLHAGGQAKPFLLARAARIFPVFLLVFTIAVAVQPWSCGFEHMPWIGPDNTIRTICVMAWPHAWMPEILAHLTMTHGLFPHAVLPDVWVSFLGAAWSLSTEWQFYLLALLVVGRWWQPHGGAGTASPAAMGDGTEPRQTIQFKSLCLVLLGLAVAGVAWRLIMPDAWHFSRAFLPNKGHFFALGVASLPVVRREANAVRRYGLVLMASLAVCAASGTVGKMLAPLLWTLCLAIQMCPGTSGLYVAGSLLRSGLAQYLGAISYCLYLVNEPIHKLAGWTLGQLARGDSVLFTMLWIPLAIGLPVAASAWLHTHLEAPALRWGRAEAKRLMTG